MACSSNAKDDFLPDYSIAADRRSTGGEENISSRLEIAGFSGRCSRRTGESAVPAVYGKADC